MTNAVSKLFTALETWSFKYNCYEAVHPWTPYCSASALDVGFTVFGEAIKLYTPLYLFSQLVQRKFDYASFKNTSQSILRSTTFISANAFFALFFFCSSQYLTGKFYYYAVAYIPGFLASSLAVMIERPGRRSSLAFYVANVASEALFRIYVSRGYVRAINHGQVYIFTIAMATIMFLAKKHGFEDDPLSAAIKMIVGPEEASKRQRKRNNISNEPNLQLLDNQIGFQTTSEDKNNFEDKDKTVRECCSTDVIAKQSGGTATNNSIIGKFKNALNWLVYALNVKHNLCPHNNCSCFSYATKASIRALLIGASAQLGLRLLSKGPIYLNNPKLIRNLLTDASLLKFGLFLSAFSGTYKASCCSLRWTLNKSTPSHCFMAALIAGPTLFIYPSPTVALYVLWKCLEALFNEAVRKDLIKNKNLFIVILYGLATNQLFYSALLDPRHMKKSYMSFLDRMSHHRLQQVNRAVLDVFGTNASSGYEDFFPDLHPKFMSNAFLGSIWIWMIEQKFAVKHISV